MIKGVARVVRMTDRLRRHPDAADVTVAEFLHLPAGVSIASLTLEPGAELAVARSDGDGEGLFVTHGSGWITSGQAGREDIVAGNIVYHDRDPDLVVGTEVGMILLHIRGGFMMPGPPG
ncbi:hypothetical protein GCM10010532_041880 [Dactylosporangium siamense]|uniref:Uncharacterized protein n=2 Tax=Dactylosporangium siamense TaxID=685454 RepID=A0A919PM88_9ACTN|nr:hypothetical protein Dsi01nite_030460 [Dactylosporangium siamense]